MKEIPKTDECIKMLKEVKVIFDPYLYESCFDEELFFKYIKLAMAILEIKLMPYVTDTVPDASDFDFDDKDGIFLDKLKNYPLVTADDLKKEFWSICPDLESIPKFLNVINVKFKEVNNEYSLGMETMENKYKILNKLVVEERISGSHECIFKDICYAAERYDFIIFKIKKVYEEFSEMAAPQQTKAQNDNTDKAQKQVVIQLTDEKKARLKSYFISGFKGIGGSVDCFEYLIIDLQKPRTGYGYAAIAKMIYKSKKATKYVQEMTFAKWYSEFCNIMGIEKKTYRPSQITITDVLKSEFYYLQ